MEMEIKQLEDKLATAQLSGREQVDDMNQLAELLYTKNVSQSAEICNNAIDLARQLKYPEAEARALLRAGMCASALRNYVESKKLLENSLAIRVQLNDEPGQAEAFHKLGNTGLFSGNYTSSLENYNKAIDLRKKLQDELGLADVYTNAGIVLGYQGNYSLAIKYHLQALKIFERMAMPARIASSATNIGVICIEQKNYDEALRMFNRALDIRKASADFSAQGDLLNNIANVFYWLGNYPESLKIQQQALDIREEAGDRQKIATSKSNLGEIYKGMGILTLAEEYYHSSIEILEELKDKKGLAKAYNNAGVVKLEQNLMAEAKAHLYLGLKYATELGLKDHLCDAFLHLSKIYALESNFQKAYEYQLQYSTLHQELLNSENSKQIAQMALTHEMEQREREAEIERIKNAELKRAYDSLEEEKARSEKLLHNILPEAVAIEIKTTGKSEAKYYESVTVMFCDIVSFTKISETLGPQQLINTIDVCYRKFDEIVEKHGIEKIKVIGDSYMCAGGVPIANTTHALDMIKAVMEMRQFTVDYSRELVSQNLPELLFRFGVNTGPVVSGIVGARKFTYDIWGDTVNVAARMEQNSEKNLINVSESTYLLVKENYSCEFRGKMPAKNKGDINMYFVEPL